MSGFGHGDASGRDRPAAPPPRLGDMSAHHVMVLSGPNLGRLGTREPEIYGSETLDDIATAVTREGDSLGLSVDFRQSNDEAELIGWIHEAVDAGSDVVLNPAAFTHYSYALRDACAMVTTQRSAAGRGAPVQPRRPRVLPAHVGGGRGRHAAPSPGSARSPTCSPSAPWRPDPPTGAAGTGRSAAPRPRITSPPRGAVMGEHVDLSGRTAVPGTSTSLRGYLARPIDTRTLAGRGRAARALRSGRRRPPPGRPARRGRLPRPCCPTSTATAAPSAASRRRSPRSRRSVAGPSRTSRRPGRGWPGRRTAPAGWGSSGSAWAAGSRCWPRRGGSRRARSTTGRCPRTRTRRSRAPARSSAATAPGTAGSRAPRRRSAPR